jgi:hypothetical protein
MNRDMETWKKGAIGGTIGTAAVMVIVVAFIIAPMNGNVARTIENDTTLYLTSQNNYWDQVCAPLENGQSYKATWTATTTVDAYYFTWAQLQHFYTNGSIGGYADHVHGNGQMEYTMTNCSEQCNVVFVFISTGYAVVTIHTTRTY